MARIYKRGKTLWISYYLNGREYRESLYLKDTRENRSLAKRIMKKKEAEIVTGVNPVIKKVKRKTLKVCYDEFLETRKKVKRAEATIDLYDYAYNKLFNFTDDIEIRKIDEKIVEEFEKSIKYSEIKSKDGEKRKLSPNTKEIIFRHLRIIFDYFVDNRYIETNPFPKKDRAPKRVNILSPELADEILDGLRKQNINQYRAIKLLLMTGLRISELCRAEFEDVDYRNDIFYIKNSKGRRVDSFPLYDELKVFLTSEFPNIEGKIVPYKSRDSLRFFRRFLSSKGYPHYTIHELRKTFISRLVNSGKFSIFDIQKIARHKDIRTTQKSYIELDMKRIGSSINDVFLRTTKRTIDEKVTNNN